MSGRMLYNHSIYVSRLVVGVRWVLSAGKLKDDENRCGGGNCFSGGLDFARYLLAPSRGNRERGVMRCGLPGKWEPFRAVWVITV